MSAELSVILTDLQKEAASVAASGRANAQRVADKLDQRLAAALPEDRPRPDCLGFQLALVDLVEHHHDELVSLDHSYVHELEDDREQRSERDLAFDELDTMLEQVRDAWAGVYGRQASLKLLGGVDVLPRDPVALERLGLRVHELLASTDFEVPPARLEGFPVDRAALAAALDKRVERLSNALKTVTNERKGSDSLLFDRSAELAETRRTVRFAAACFQALLGLAGLDELAAKVRPKQRRRRRNGAGGTGSGPSGNGDAANGETATSETAPATDEPERTGPIGLVS